MDTISPEQVMHELQLFTERVSLDFNVQQVILFGSRARDDWLYASDVDLVVVSDDFVSIPFMKRMARMLNYWALPLDVDVLCYTVAEFERKKQEIGIVRTAIKEGKVLVNR